MKDMTKSKIIKELANEEIDVTVALKRLKVLLADLNKPELYMWVDNELNGYSSEAIPPYRKFAGYVKGTYVIGRRTFTDCPIPTFMVPNELKEYFNECCFTQSIFALKDSGADHVYQKIIMPEYYKYLMEGTNITGIIRASVNTDVSDPVSIIAAVETKILDILILLEKEFGNLDELDIDVSEKSPEELSKVTTQIYYIINSNDESINIGDGNKFSNSEIKNNSD